MFVLIFSIILIVCQALIVLLPLLFKQPVSINILPLVALALLWINNLFFQGKNGTSVTSVILWVLFGFICLASLAPVMQSLMSYADKEKNREPVIMGNPDSLKNVIMVYHPGGSPLPERVNTMVAERISQSGIKVTLYTANAGIQIDPKTTTAIGLSSPVYGSVIRPPLDAFIKRIDLRGIKCFVIITGWVIAGEKEILERMQKLIESKGGIFIGGRKFNSSGAKQAEAIQSFADNIKDKF